jgi:hypothetical protein
MESRQALVYESIKQSLVALGLPPLATPQLAAMRTELEEALRTIDRLLLVQLQNTGRRGAGPEIKKLRSDIGKRLRQISNTATVCLDGLPGIRDEVRPPRMNASNVALIEGTARVIRNARPHFETLRRNGLDADAIERLEALTAELSTKAAAPNLPLAERSRATNALPGALRRGRDLIRAIDSSIKVILADDTPALRVWNRAKRIPGKPGRPKKKRKPGA